MKRIAVLPLLALAACSPQPVAAPSPTSTAGVITTQLCTEPQTREIALTAPGAKDVLRAEAVGGECAQSAVLFTATNADGKLLWSFALPAGHSWAGIPRDGDQPPPPEQGVRGYMEDVLKAAEVKTSSAAPDWPEGAPRPADPTGLYITTDRTRDDYVAARAANLPVLCLEPEMGVGRCVLFDPANGGYVSAFYEMHS
jgi:hypothetical protein